MAALVEAHDFPETGRGQRATRAIRKGEVVRSVALEDCWTPAAARAAPALAALLPALDGLPPPRVLKTPLLALHLLAERARGAASERRAHIQALPRVFDTPLHWTEDELSALCASGSDWHGFAARARAEAVADYDELVAAVGARALEALGADAPSYLWASTAFQSRLMDIRGAEPLMAPHLDLFNHTADPRARGAFGLDAAGGRVQVTAYRDYAAGEQVFISYGAHSNARLLFSYGFALGAANPCDAVELADRVRFGPAATDAAAQLRAGLVLRAAMPHTGGLDADDESRAAPAPLALDIPSVSELASADERAQMRLLARHALSLAVPLPTGLLVLSRLAQLSDAELRALDAAPALFDAAVRGVPLSAENEGRCVAELRARLRALAGRARAGPSAPAAESACAARRAALAASLASGEAAILAAAERALDAHAAGLAAIQPLLPGAGLAGGAESVVPHAHVLGGVGPAAAAAAAVEPVALGAKVGWAAASAAAGPAPPGAERVLVCLDAVRAGELLWSAPLLSHCYSTDAAAADARVGAALGGRAEGVPRRALVPLLIALERAAADAGPAEAAERVASAAALSARLARSPPLTAWAGAELSALAGSRWLAELEDTAEETRADWAALSEALAQSGTGAALLARAADGGAAALSLASYGAAVRAWHGARSDARAEGGQPVAVLVPALAEGCVHDDRLPHGPSVTLERDGAGTLHACVRALAPAARGARVRARLGWEPDGELLLRRGFALARNAHARFDLSLTVACTSRTLDAAMLAAPEAPSDLLAPSVFEFARVPTDSALAEAGEEGAALVTRHSLTEAAPLPPALLALLRLERLTGAELAQVEASLGRKGTPLWLALQQGAQLAAANELHALHAAEAIAHAHLARYTAADADGAPDTPADAARARPPSPPSAAAAPAECRTLYCTDAAAAAAAAAEAVRADVHTLRALAAEAQRRRRELVETSMLARLHALPGKRPDDAAPWSHFLRQTRPRLEREAERIALTCGRLYQSVDALARLAPAQPEARREAHALLARVCAAAFGWLVGCAPEPSAADAPPSGGALGTLYEAKVRLWGCFLLAQWCEALSLGLAEMNAMLMESVDIRATHSWSVPAARALGALCALGPLTLAGDPNGTWLRELEACGADVVAHDARAGAPAPARALVAIWSDANGRGSAGLDLVRAFEGSTLATIGEWEGRTYGAYADGLEPRGQSFSAECQAFVAGAYELRAETALPNWPLAKDALLVWERKEQSSRPGTVVP